jgi:hypothetical protein
VPSSSHGAVMPLCMGRVGVQGFSQSALEDLLKPEYRGCLATADRVLN